MRNASCILFLTVLLLKRNYFFEVPKAVENILKSEVHSLTPKPRIITLKDTAKLIQL